MSTPPSYHLFLPPYPPFPPYPPLPLLQIGLVTELLGVAGRALAAHPGLVPLSLGLQLGGWLLLNLPLLGGMLAGLANGSLAYNTARSAQGGDGGSAAAGEECRGEGGEQVLCCVWQVGGEVGGVGVGVLGGLGTQLVLCCVWQVGYGIGQAVWCEGLKERRSCTCCVGQLGEGGSEVRTGCCGSVVHTGSSQSGGPRGGLGTVGR